MYFEAEFTSFDHVIRGYVDTSEERLSNFLNLKSDTFVLIHEARISRLFETVKSPPIFIPEARMEKQSIIFAYPIEHDMTSKSIYRRVIKQTCYVTVLVPNFELTGLIHIPGKFDVRRFIFSHPNDFIPVTDATATYSLRPSVRLKRNTILVNKSKMILIGEYNPAGTLSDGSEL